MTAIVCAPLFFARVVAAAVSGVPPPKEHVITIAFSSTAAGVAYTNSFAV